MVLALVLGAGVIPVGCSGGSPAGGGTGGTSVGMGGAPGSLEYKPCPEATRAGGFSVQLVAAAGAVSAFTSVAGGVKDAPDPRAGRVEKARNGACVLTDAPSLNCVPTCTGGDQICAGNNRCITEPTFQDVGTVSITGLPGAVTLMPFSNKQYSAQLTGIAYPPFADGAAVKLSTTGGEYPAFTLSGRGITPLDFAGNGLDVRRNSALNVTWTAPPSGAAARIFVRMDISHHGGGAARIECEVPDTGSATVPAALINQLLDQGSAGFPTLSLTRRTVDSVTIAAGCVDLTVSSPVERPLTVEGEVSCTCTVGDAGCGMDDSVPCPAGRTCWPLGDPKALTCGP